MDGPRLIHKCSNSAYLSYSKHRSHEQEELQVLIHAIEGQGFVCPTVDKQSTLWRCLTTHAKACCHAEVVRALADVVLTRSVCHAETLLGLADVGPKDQHWQSTGGLAGSMQQTNLPYREKKAQPDPAAQPGCTGRQ